MSSDQSLWDFSCDCYAGQRVQTACLQLQEQHNWNIPLLFFCCWAGLRYGALSAIQLQQAKQFAESFSVQTVKPLRLIRETMKSGINPSWPLSESEWSQLREQVKTVELEAEERLLQGLEKQMADYPLHFGGVREVIKNIEGCFDVEALTPSLRDLVIVVGAVFPDHHFQELGEDLKAVFGF